MHAREFMAYAAAISHAIEPTLIESMATELAALRERGGRLFVIGLGGSAANASHAAADFRKLCSIVAYAPTDSVAEFSARVNDEGFANAFTGFLWDAERGDALMVLSVGGGTETVSQPISEAVRFAKDRGISVLGVVGPDGGVTGELASVCVKVPAPRKHITPMTEAFQMVVVHCLVSHPLLQRRPTKW